jgi:hypothetical protein
MTRLAIIGNSHVAALKLAWDAGGFDDAVTVTFFAAPGRGNVRFEAEDGALVPVSERTRESILHTSGADRVAPETFDAFLIYGLHKSPALDEDISALSAAVRRALVIDRVTGQPNYRILTQLRSITDKPIFVGLSPRLAETGAALAAPVVAPDAEYALLMEEVYGPLNARLVPQPAETLTAGGQATLGAFSQGSQRLVTPGRALRSTDHGETDNTHMNADYGRLWLAAFLPMLTRA